MESLWTVDRYDSIRFSERFSKLDLNFSPESLHLFHGACIRNILEYIKPYVKLGYPINSHADSSFGKEFTGYTPLHFAVKNKNKEAIIYLLDKGADITKKSDNGWTPIHLAYYCSGYDLVFTMFEHSKINSYVNVADNAGITHFLICCALNAPVIDKFITSGALKYEPVNKKKVLFDLAVINRQYAVVEAMLSQRKSEDGIPASFSAIFDLDDFHDACRHGSLNDVKAFLNHGFSVNDPVESNFVKKRRGYLPLHVAVMNGNVDMVQYLISEGASICAKNRKKETPFHLAVKYRQYEVLEAMLPQLIKHKDGTPVTFSDVFNPNDFHDACSQGDLNDIKTFLKHGFSINSHAGLDIHKKYQGYTPLHFAVEDKREDIIIYLLENGADITEKSDNGWTPIHQAYYNECKDLIPTIFKHSKINTYVDTADDKGLTHFHICCILDFLDIIADFIKNEVDINCSTLLLADSAESGFTPLHFAVKTGNTQVIKLLLENGANHSSRCKGGLTPLHLACDLDVTDAVELLLKSGADFMTTDDKNRLPLHCIFYKKHTSVLADILFDKIPTDHNHADYQRLSILHMACYNKKVTIVKRLLAEGCCPNMQIIKFNKNSNETILFDGVDLAGKTPLHMASYAINFEIFKELLLAGADINALDDAGDSPLAFIYNQSNFVETPRRLGSDLRPLGKLILNHLRKLKVAKLPISAKVRQEHSLRNFPIKLRGSLVKHITCIIELERLEHLSERIKVNGCGEGILLSIIYNNEMEMYRLVKNEELMTVLNPEYLDNLIKILPVYGFMIKAQVNKGLRIAARIQKAKNSLNCLTGINVPDLCSEKILKHLRVEHLETLIDAGVVVQKKD